MFIIINSIYIYIYIYTYIYIYICIPGAPSPIRLRAGADAGAAERALARRHASLCCWFGWFSSLIICV